MFLSSLSYEQRKVFLGLAKEILTVDDGVIDNSEDSYLRSLCAEMSLSYNDEMKVEKSDLIKIFQETDEKRIALLELVALGYSNKDYHPSQDKFTDDMAVALEIPIEELRTIEELFKKYSQIQNEFVQYVNK